MAHVTNLRDAFSFSFDILRVINFFKYEEVIHDTMMCDYCRKNMSMQKFATALDGYIWRCTTCKKTASIRKHSYFENLRVYNLGKIYLVMFCILKHPKMLYTLGILYFFLKKIINNHLN